MRVLDWSGVPGRGTVIIDDIREMLNVVINDGDWMRLLVSCSRWWCPFDDDDNVREMIVRAMTSESGEMCNLEDVRTWPSEQGQEIEFKEELKELRTCCTTWVADENQWPIHKKERPLIQLGGWGHHGVFTTKPSRMVPIPGRTASETLVRHLR